MSQFVGHHALQFSVIQHGHQTRLQDYDRSVGPEGEDYTDKTLRFLLEIGTTHPFPVRRVSELLRWVRSGNYDRILRGDYIRRGYEPPIDKEFERMVDHYSRTFSELLGSAGKGLKGFSKDLADWLDRQNDWVNQQRRQQEGDS